MLLGISPNNTIMFFEINQSIRNVVLFDEMVNAFMNFAAYYNVFSSLEDKLRIGGHSTVYLNGCIKL